jgi:geranylgeranyl pyrophosphate synthase
LFIKALEKARGHNRNYLSKVIENKGIKKNQVKNYKVLYEKLGVLEDAKKEIKKYTNQALNSLKVFNSEQRKIFYWLADALIKRTR